MRTEPSFSTDSDQRLLDEIDRSGGGASSHVDTESQLLSDYCQRYGLSIDPFIDDPHFPFYTGGQRRQTLEQLLHLCQFSHNLLVVAGDYGVGKTRMAQALIDALDDADDICFVEGQITSDIDSVLAEVFAQFELSSLLEFTDLCKKKSEQDGLLVLIVDNAHHLTDDVILGLINLLQENQASRLHLVLFAEPHLLDRLDNINAPDLVLTDLLLEKLSLSESVDYLNFRMEMADYLGPEVFTEGKVEPWWRQFQGQLLSLHEHAQEKLLASVASPESFKSVKSNPLVPHIVATSILVGGLLLGYLYLGADSPTKQVDSVVDTPAPLKPLASAAPSTQAIIDSRPVVASTSSISSHIVSVSDTHKAELGQPNRAISTLTTSESNSVKTQVDTAVKQSVVPLAQTNSLDNNAFQKQKSMNASVQPSSKESQKIAVSSEPSRIAAPSKSNDVEAEVGLVKQGYGLSDQENTILGWGPSEFTLQLVGLSNEKAARDFIVAQSNKKDLLLFKSLRQGKDWFVVVTGRFPTSANARQAIQNLPAAQRQASPWPREIKVIQQEIKQR